MKIFVDSTFLFSSSECQLYELQSISIQIFPKKVRNYDVVDHTQTYDSYDMIGRMHKNDTFPP